MTRKEIATFELEVLELLKDVMDPEIEINIVDLGLIYEVNYKGENEIAIVFHESSNSLLKVHVLIMRIYLLLIIMSSNS